MPEQASGQADMRSAWSLSASADSAMLIDGTWSRQNLSRDLLENMAGEAAAARGRGEVQAVDLAQVQGGVALVTIAGPLFAEGNFITEYMGWATYQDLAETATELRSREDVERVVLYVDSPGGMVRRLEDAHTALAALAAEKPVTAFVSRGTSAAYWLASVADRIVAEPGGSLGSIGVVATAVQPVAASLIDGFQVFQIVSPGAENKVPDLRTDSGVASIQASLAPIEARFRAAVGAARGLEGEALAQAVDAGRVFDPEEALQRGLIDEIQTRGAFAAAQGVPLPGGTSSSAGAAHSNRIEEKETMPKEIENKDAGGTSAADNKAPQSVATPPGLDAQAVAATAAEAVAAERQRQAEIRTIGRKVGMAAEAIEEACAGETSVEDFRKKAIDHMAEASAQATEGLRPYGAIQGGADASERFVQGATEGMLARSGHNDGQRNEFSGLSLAELARHALAVRNVRADPDRMRMIGQAFTLGAAAGGMHAPGDFPTILANVANKFLLMGYEAAGETFQRWTARKTAPDFRPISHTGLHAMPALRNVPDGAEYKYVTIGERGETAQLATYGELFSITRHTIINDDLNAFTEIPRRMGSAAIGTVGNIVYAVLTANEVMADGTALFHADHGNLGTAGAPSATTLAEIYKLMRAQKSGGATARPLNITPRFIMCPPALKFDLDVLMNSATVPGSTVGDRNPFQSLAEVVDEQRLADDDADAWYVAADPGRVDTVAVYYLNGNDQPYMEEEDGFRVDGVTYKVRIDAAAKALDFRGLAKNAG